MDPQIPSHILGAITPRHFNLILYPTEQCNFRCVYCYEDFKVGLMEPRVVAGVKQLLSRRMPELDFLAISWFGGEPLLAKGILYEIGNHIREAAKHLPQLTITGNVTTNGSLLDGETFRKLAALSIQQYQISLDGDCDLHNQTRRGKNGDGTFDAIWRNLLAIREASDIDARIILRVHFSPTTWRKLDPLIASINEAFGADPRFQVHFKSVDRLGGAHDSEMPVFSDQEKDEAKAELQSRLAGTGMAYKLTAEGPYVCYASKANSLAVRANGDLNKCTVALYDKGNRVGKLCDDGTVEVDRDRLLPWLKGLETQDPQALACPLSTIRHARWTQIETARALQGGTAN